MHHYTNSYDERNGVVAVPALIVGAGNPPSSLGQGKYSMFLQLRLSGDTSHLIELFYASPQTRSLLDDFDVKDFREFKERDRRVMALQQNGVFVGIRKMKKDELDVLTASSVA